MIADEAKATLREITANLPDSAPVTIISNRRGGIAQLGERLHGMQEVSGSIPLTSTTNKSASRSAGLRYVQVPIV